MSTNDLSVRPLNPAHSGRIVELVQLLNPKLRAEVLVDRLRQQWALEGYHIFGLFREERLIGVASGWVSIRLYGGKLAELDNVIVDPADRGAGTGTFFLTELETFFKGIGCRRIELKTYTGNKRSHRFYHRNDFSIYAFYFVKEIHEDDGEDY